MAAGEAKEFAPTKESQKQGYKRWRALDRLMGLSPESRAKLNKKEWEDLLREADSEK